VFQLIILIIARFYAAPCIINYTWDTMSIILVEFVSHTSPKRKCVTIKCELFHSNYVLHMV